MLPFAVAHQIETPKKFIPAMKADHRLAVEYCTRLLRISTAWCGTINKVITHVRRDAVEEFQTFLHVGIGAAPALDDTSDKARILKVVKIANDPEAYHEVQAAAAKELLRMADEDWPHNGCAINLSDLLQAGGIPVPKILQALALGKHLQDHRRWQVIPNGEQQPGDVGSTCGPIPNDHSDHIYLVLQRVDNDEMIIADNQKPGPHTRFVSGKGGKSPTKFFLRAP